MLACPSCQRAYAAEDLDLSLAVAHCAGCAQVGELRVAAAGPAAAPVLTAAAPLAPPKPGAWSEHEEGGTLVLERRWFGLESVFVVLFTLFWDGVLVLMFVSLLLQEGAEALMLLVMPHSWVGVGLAYYSVAIVMNRTTIRVDTDAVSVSYAPVPWWGARRFGREQVDQLYVEESGVRVNRQPRWNLALMDHDRTGHVLLRLLTSPAEARWLEHRIEHRLGVTDRAVFGEVPK